MLGCHDALLMTKRATRAVFLMYALTLASGSTNATKNMSTNMPAINRYDFQTWFASEAMLTNRVITSNNIGGYTATV